MGETKSSVGEQRLSVTSVANVVAKSAKPNFRYLAT